MGRGGCLHIGTLLILSHARPAGLADEEADCNPPQLMREAAVHRCLRPPHTQHAFGPSRSRSRAPGRARPPVLCEQRPIINPAVHRLRPEPRQGRILPGSRRRHGLRRSLHELDRGGRLRGAPSGERHRGTQSVPQPGRQDPTLVLL